MKVTLRLVAAICFYCAAAGVVWGQDLDPQIRKIKDGIYVYVGKNFNSNAGIVLTQEGVVLIDSGHNPTDSKAIAAAVKKLTPLPVRFLIDTEPHPDHTTGHFVHSPPAVIIAHEGATESMKGRERDTPGRIQKLAGVSPEIGAALQGYRFVPPHIEYQKKMTLNVGERTFELLYLHGVHSEADTAVWLPQERVLFAGSAAIPNSLNNVRAFVTIADLLAAARMLRSLNPEVVVPGHGSPGTTTIFDESEKYYTLLLERVTAMVKAGKTREQIGMELKMPEYAGWAYQDRMPSNIDAAYRAATSR